MPFNQLPIGIVVTCFMVGFFVAIGYLASLLKEDVLKDSETVIGAAAFCTVFFVFYSFANVSAASLFIGNEGIFYFLAIVEIALVLVGYVITARRIEKRAKINWFYKNYFSAVYGNGQYYALGRPSPTYILRVIVFVVFGIFAAIVLIAKIIIFFS